MPSTLTRLPRKTVPRIEKVSVTLRIPTELKLWADEFASKSHLDISGLFIQSLRETQKRGELRIAPSGYRDEEAGESDFSPLAWGKVQDSIHKHEENIKTGKAKWYDSPRELHDAILANKRT